MIRLIFPLLAGLLGLRIFFLGRRPALLPRARRVLIVGDSQSASPGTFGQQLAGQLRETGVQAQVLAANGVGVLTAGNNCTASYFTTRSTPGSTGRLESELASFRPDLVLVELGGNDAWCHGNPASKARYQEAVASFAGLIRASGARLRWLGPSFADAPEGYQARRTRIGQYQREVLDRLGVPWVDMAGLTADLPRRDGVHATPTGYIQWAARVAPHLEAWLGRT